MRLCLHIGTEKTGSSHLQTLMVRGRESLASSSVHAPNGWRHDEQEMSAGRISAGNARKLTQMVAEGDGVSAMRTLRASVIIAKSQRHDRVLLSSEWLLPAP